MNWGRFAVLAGSAALLLTIAGSFGAASAPAEPLKDCAGKQLCVTVDNQLQASRTPTAGPDHYLTHTVTLDNESTSANLVNLTLTITWRDLPAPATPTTTAYRPAFSSSECTETGTGTNTLTCTLPKALAPADEPLVFELVFRTATNAAASDFELTATATAKEQAKPKKGGQPPNDAVASQSNSTTYEGDLDKDISIGGGGITTTIATAAGHNKQNSSLLIPETADRQLYTITEANCPPGSTTCIGQSVTTTAVGLSPVILQIVYEGPVPSGTNANGIVVLHTRDGDADPTVIDDKCSGEIFVDPIDEDEIHCRRVRLTKIDASANIYRVEVEAADLENGKWDFG
jgi:hypothetical protein